ncbi:MAG: hypothetical protein KAH48_01660 [Chlorobi bacterium]|nr:hypothetical protein [Chlorobiota bacterium]
MEKLLDTNTISEGLGISKSKVLDLMKSGKLWHKRIDHRYYSRESKIELFVNGVQSEALPAIVGNKKLAAGLGLVTIPDGI